MPPSRPRGPGSWLGSWLGLLGSTWIGLWLCAGCAEPLPPQPPAPLRQSGLWVWSNLPSVSESEALALVDFAASRKINTLYVQAQTVVYDAPGGLSRLIVLAADRGIQVELLAGALSWAWPKNHPQVLQLVADLDTFTRTLPGPQPVAVHLNIEPHALPEWDGQKAELAGATVDLLAKVRLALQGSPLHLVMDMPNWYGGLALKRQGVQRSLAQWLLDEVDRIVVMDYDDDLGDQVQLVADELAQAALVGKSAIVGLETQCGLDDDVTLCEEGLGALNQDLEDLGRELGAKAAFGGVAVHHWQSLLLMAP